MHQILIDRIEGATRLALIQEGALQSFVLDVDARPSLLDSIHLARVTDVIPSISAAFLDIGGTEAMLNYRHEPPVVGALKIVQVATDAHAEKELRVVDNIALTGRFAVLRPSGSGVTISQAIGDRRARSRLQAALPDGLDGGITVRSRAAALLDDDRTDIMTSELLRLAGLLGEALEQAESMDAPGLLLPAPTAIERAVRDWAADGADITIAEAALLKPLNDALERLAPDITLKPRFDAQPGLFARHGVEDDLAALGEPTLALPGGGTVSIYETPALTAIDVDSGHARSWAPDQTADSVNAAAAAAIARQLRLRQIGGTVVVDFMGFDAHASRALAHLRDALADDPLASRPVGASGHGLAIMTRRRLGPSLHEQFEALKRPAKTESPT